MQPYLNARIVYLFVSIASATKREGLHFDVACRKCMDDLYSLVIEERHPQRTRPEFSIDYNQIYCEEVR